MTNTVRRHSPPGAKRCAFTGYRPISVNLNRNSNHIDAASRSFGQGDGYGFPSLYRVANVEVWSDGLTDEQHGDGQLAPQAFVRFKVF